MEENTISTPSVEVSEPATQYSEPSVDTSTDTSASETTGTSSEPQVIATASEMSVVEDPVTGKRSIKYDSEGDDNPQENQEFTDDYSNAVDDENRGTDSIAMGQQNLNPSAKYTLEEFSNALANGRVNPERVPQEYQAQYADYRIREAIQQRQAQQQQAYEQETARRKQIEMQMNPENRIQANKDFYSALEQEASEKAFRDLGITQDDLDEAEFADNGEELKQQYQNAKDWHKQQLRNEMQARYQQEQAYKYQQQQTYGDIQAFVSQEKAKEPNFDAIDARLATRYQTLPLSQGRVIEQALGDLQRGTITPQGVQIIQNYYNAVRKEYYAEKNGLASNGRGVRRPPVVENAGSGQQVNHNYKPNYASLRGANVNQRAAWFKEYFKNKGW